MGLGTGFYSSLEYVRRLGSLDRLFFLERVQGPLVYFERRKCKQSFLSLHSPVIEPECSQLWGGEQR